MEVINLNFIPSGANPVAHASQFDEGRTTRFNLFDGSAVYTLDGTEIITVSVRKPDGHIVTEAVTNTSDNYVEVVTTEQMTACAGDNLAQIKVEKGGDTIGFLNYILQVQKDPEDGGDPSESFIHDLSQQIADAVSDQYDSNNVIFDAAPTAGHGVGYAVTSEGIDSAIPDELDDLSDVTTSALTSGEALVWDGSKWTNGTPDMDVSDLADVTITTPSDDDILVYQNGEWVNMANPASTANFGADYDENTTYNTGDKCVYNNLLYECNDDGVTGTWDATKWDSLTVASMTDNNLPHFSGTPAAGSTAEAIGDLSTLTTTDKSSLVGAVNELDSDKADKAVGVTVSVATGVSLIHNSSVAVDKLVACNFALEKTGGWSSGWQVAGTVSKIPSTNVSAPLWNITNGIAMGMVRIDAITGNINLYVPTAANVRAEVNICYST